MKATIINIREVLGVHAKGITFTKKTFPVNGYVLRGFLPRIAIIDLNNNFHIYITKDGGLAVISPGRLSVSQTGI